jgi:hypothetical protein
VDEIAHLLQDQHGVVARRQVLAVGTTEAELATWLRRRHLHTHHPGVYIEHNGPPTWLQRAWAAVLHAERSALYLESARRAAEGPGRRGRGAHDGPIDIAVPWPRKVVGVPGVRVHRVRDLEVRVQWHLSPPRVRYDETVIDLAAAADDDLEAVAVLADACGSRRTTAARLALLLAGRRRVARRSWLTAVLADVANGACSVLEQGFLEHVVRPHGLPVGTMQALRRTSAGIVVRDVEHADLGLVVELDGRLFHETAEQRDDDLDRDLIAAVEADLRTVRLGWRQVFRHGCRTAALLGRLMQRLGWSGAPRRCPRCP